MRCRMAHSIDQSVSAGRRHVGCLILALAALWMVTVGHAAPPSPETETQKLQFFETQVRPLLSANCFKCHGGEKVKGGLRLTSRKTILAGGDSGPAVSLDDPSKSLLLHAIGYTDDNLQMPPKQKLSPDQIAVLTKWAAMGAPFSPTAEVIEPAQPPMPARRIPPPVNEENRKFWSFQPVRRPDIPAVKEKGWVRNPIDAFVLAKLETKGLSPAPAASKTALLRRAFYDLTGLPPTPADVRQFLADPSPTAYEAVIDRLLASPQYGEKWGRHWLDLVRYAETNSYERDGDKPNVWRFRDYVIRSFNADKPYDEFVKEQLAGDEIPRRPDDFDPIVATGYYRLGIWDDEPADRLQARFDGLDDIVATTGQVFLGLTVDCARCHDHKIDPIPQKDYYRLLSFFQNITPYHNGGDTDLMPILANDGDRDAYDQRLKERDQRRKQLKALIKGFESDFRQLLAGQSGQPPIELAEAVKLIKSQGAEVLGAERFHQYEAYKRELAAVEKSSLGTDMALCVSEEGPTAPDTFVLMRGNANVPGAKVEPAFLSILTRDEPVIIPKPADDARTTGRRTVLANWIASKDNPMTARVMANRIFQYHFGRGIVRSASNFGFLGDKPTHPELLDWLASEFIADGWHLKPLHRLIMTSNAYRMACEGDPATIDAARNADPQNDLLWRFDLRRLTAEEARDSILAVNGTLNFKMFGPSIYPPIPQEVLAGQSRPGEGWHTSAPEEATRRSIYIHLKRSLHVPIIESLDMAETDKSCPVRFVTVQPTQALSLMNSEFLNEESEKFAERLRKEAGDDPARQVEAGLRLGLCRAPSQEEIARGVRLIQSLRTHDGASPELALKYFCLMVYNLNEFVYLD
jgi:hypothetical protein